MSVTRLAIVTETYLPDINGVANSLHQLLVNLDPQRFDIRIYRPQPRQAWQPRWPEYWCRGMRIPMYPDLQLGLPRRHWLIQRWQSWLPDVVYIATEGPLGMSALRAARRLGVPVVSAFHTNFHRYGDYYGLGWIRRATVAWLRYFHNQTRLTLVPSEDSALALHEVGIKRVAVLLHGVDGRHFHPSKRCTQLRQSWGAGPVLLYVGRIAGEKNIPVAIRTYQQLRQVHAGLRLVMVGDGPLRASLQRQHPDIVFTGVLTGDALARHYASADALVFPSLTETFGLVTLEAMASGLPVAAYCHAAARQFVRSGHNGELADDDTEASFQRACERLLAGDCVQQGRNARVAAEAADWAAIAEQFEHYLLAVMQPASGPQNRVQSVV
ncbi:glycoside hydrolase [Bacterioplanes sanyensis]|uniref:glycosyltransferase family 4 protein n=1 Tax=Bacterioplanes sanyensis TaxID=1249553 RepID=UPI00167A0833|nr:glycosyltransferase family 1 protein [Bacterioplanes sanyensis]GGY38478.1 glycoside hydrolase [Bacterioplanes sanyensis]